MNDPRYRTKEDQDRLAAHQAKYAALVKLVGPSYLKDEIIRITSNYGGLEALPRLIEEDIHLNNIPLGVWDSSASHLIVRFRFVPSESTAEGDLTTGTWQPLTADNNTRLSLGERVCLLKERARQLACEPPPIKEPEPCPTSP